MSSADHSEVERLIEEAGQLARICRTDEARANLDRAQRLLTASSPAEQRAALTLAHSFCLFFETRLDEAIAENRRARALATEAGDVELECDCDATLALFHTRGGKMHETVRLARAALARAGAHNSVARYRAHLALATVMQMAGLPEAFEEYRAAREHARRIHDEIAVAAAFHRMAVAQALKARQLFETGELGADTLRQAIVGVQSSIGMLGDLAPTATTAIENLLLAELYLMQGEFEAATALYEAFLPRARAEGHDAVMVQVPAELALCRARAGRSDEALELVRAALAAKLDGCDAFALGTLYRAVETVYRWLGRIEEQRRYDELARASWDDFRASQQRWRELLGEPNQRVN